MIVTCPNCGAKNRVDESRSATMAAICGRCKAKLPLPDASASHPIDLTDDTFDGFLHEAGNKPVLVDCWAPWCGPCRALAPAIEQLAAEADGRYLVAKLNTDENQRTAARFHIDAIPLLLIFKNSNLVNRLVGLQPKAAIARKLREAEA